MRLVEGKGWVKESDLIESEKSEKEKNSASKQSGGSKLKNVTSAVNNEARDNSDAEGEDDDDATPVKKTDKGGKTKVNGNVSEGGMISPESLEASL